MRPIKDLTGKRFGKLVVIGQDTKQYYWLCKCDCGNTTSVNGAKLNNGHTKSCGCLVAETFEKYRTKHNGKHTRLYRIWCAMKDRCYGSGENNTKNYSERGITVCDEWKNDFVAFRDWAIANGYRNDLTLDRKNNDDGYFPGNCRWVTMIEQANNKRSNHFIIYDGEMMTMAQLARKTGINYSTLRSRINRNKLSAEEAVLRG